MYSKYAVNSGNNWQSNYEDFAGNFVVDDISTQSPLAASYLPNNFYKKKGHHATTSVNDKKCLQSYKELKQFEDTQNNSELPIARDETATKMARPTNRQTQRYRNLHLHQSDFESQTWQRGWNSTSLTQPNLIQDPYKKFSNNNNYEFNVYGNPSNLKPYRLPIFESRQQQEPLYAKNQRNFNPAYDQHYQHYYSYFYKCNPTDCNQRSKSGRSTALYAGMPSLNKNHSCDPFASANAADSNVNDLFSDNLRYTAKAQQKVLKDKIPNSNNNNSNLAHRNDWYFDMSNTQALKGAGDYEEDYSSMQEKATVKYYNREYNALNLQLDVQGNKKSKLQTLRSDSDAYNVLNVLKETGNRIAAGDDQSAKTDNKSNPAYNNGNTIYYPMSTPLLKTRAVLKNAQLSPSRSRRVLLYNSQSPRLRRLSSTHIRHQRPRNKFKAEEGINWKQSPYNRNNNKVLQGRIRVLKSMSPTKDIVNGQNKIDDNANINCPVNHISDDSDTDEIDDVDNDSDDSIGSHTSSDSEDGYRSFAYKLTHSIDHVPSIKAFLACHQCEEDLTNPPNVLVASLFPNVPPYLSFSSSTKKGPTVPPDLYRVLKWRVSNVMPRIVRCILANSGMRLLKKTNDWMGVWGKHMKSPCFKSIRAYQKINHLPGSFRIGRKDSCWKNLSKLMTIHGKRDFGFMPKTYIIPNDLRQLRKSWPSYAQRKIKWILKPPASTRGTGIRVVDRWSQIPKRRPLIVQKYIEKPLLINGSKFDLRLYVLVTSVNPLRVYMYHNGLARFASVKYSDKSDTLNDRCMHLTNYSINKLSSNYLKNEDVNACQGHKWTIKSLWNYLSTRGVRIECLWEALRNLVLRTILAGENSINNMIKTNVESKYSCFELFGFDVLLDADLIPWLLEVNISPSLHSDLPLDSHVKAPLVQSVLNTALYNVPPKLPIDRQIEIAEEMSLPPGPICYDKRMYINYLSRVEKVKHANFTRKSMEDRDEYLNAILEHLTPDDVRCLIISEDELARCKPLERVFPTPDTHKYLKFTKSPRYYNRLLDAWETRYANSREDGIAVLRRLCEDKYHLQVPTMPAKKDSSDDDVEDDDSYKSPSYSNT